MSAASWTITNPGGSGTSPLAELGLSDPAVNFRVMAVSEASMTCHRDFDSEDAWWEYDELVTVYRDGQPFFQGRVQENPDAANGGSETRTLHLADAWLDLEQIIYREPWAIGSGSALYPRCILGRNAAGENITTGGQIAEVISHAISQGAEIQAGTIDEGYQLWPSEARNQSCESVIIGEMRFHPDWVAWLDHSTSPPTFHARAKGALDAVTVDIADGDVENFQYTEVKRTVPRGVAISYESADTVDGEVYRASYTDTAGETSGRRILRAMVDLEGMNVSYQKSRIETRPLPTDGASMTAYMKLKYPELADMPDAAFSWSNVSFLLAPEGAQPPPVNAIAVRLAKEAAAELPRELVRGSIEDWMRKKVGRVIVKYDLKIIGSPSEAQKKILDNFSGKAKTFSVTATNAITKLYKGVSSYTAGEGRPTGLAAAIFASATEQQWEGRVTMTYGDVPASRWHGKKLTLTNGENTLLAGAVVHSAAADIDAGRVTVEFGPMPYLSAGDFLDLQRILNGRGVSWMSAAERTSNELGSELTGGSKGDIVGGYDSPDTCTPPGGKHLPEGDEGDMLFNDGTDWVVLAAPEGAGPFVLMHDATAPYWEATEECSA